MTTDAVDDAIADPAHVSRGSTEVANMMSRCMRSRCTSDDDNVPCVTLAAEPTSPQLALEHSHDWFQQRPIDDQVKTPREMELSGRLELSGHVESPRVVILQEAEAGTGKPSKKARDNDVPEIMPLEEMMERWENSQEEVPKPSSEAPIPAFLREDAPGPREPQKVKMPGHDDDPGADPDDS